MRAASSGSRRVRTRRGRQANEAAAGWRSRHMRFRWAVLLESTAESPATGPAGSTPRSGTLGLHLYRAVGKNDATSGRNNGVTAYERGT